MNWKPTSEEMPPLDTKVLIYMKGEERVGELREDRGDWEESYARCEYWDDPYDDGKCWDHEDVTHWMPLPEPPTP